MSLFDAVQPFGGYSAGPLNPFNANPSTPAAPSTPSSGLYIPPPGTPAPQGPPGSGAAVLAAAGGGTSTGTADFSASPYTGPTSPSYPTVPQFNFPGFSAPTGANEQNDPGYAFRLAQGEGALQNSAAAQGILNTGGTLEGILNYGQNYASNEYQNVYNRALQSYGANLGTAEANFAPQMAQYNLQGQGSLQAFQQAMQLYQIQQQIELQNKGLAFSGPSGT